MDPDRSNALGFAVNAWALGRVFEGLNLPPILGGLVTAVAVSWQRSEAPATRALGTLLTLPGTVAVSMTTEPQE